MAQIEIPTAWTTEVCRILKTGKAGKDIIWTKGARERFEADFPGAWGYQAQDDLRHHLSTPGKTGCRVEMDHPAGETYEFLFRLQNRLSYGKILLTMDKKTIYLFSAHLPLKEGLSCDPKPQPQKKR